MTRDFVERLSRVDPATLPYALPPVLDRDPYLSAWTNVQAALGLMGRTTRRTHESIVTEAAMLTTVLRGWIPLVGLIFYPAQVATPQTFYAGAGVGPTPVLGDGSGNRNWFGMVGYRGRGAFGARLSGAETAERLWLSADLCYRLNPRERALRPYALLGTGLVLDLNEADALFTAGAGLRAQLHRLLFAFGEVRLQAIPGSPADGPSTILPITLGLGLGR